MKLKQEGAEIFIPDNKPVDEAIKRTTCMGISAHQDDIEIMAYKGIINCFKSEDEWFFGVVVTNGAGSSRNGLYTGYTDEEMQKVRRIEQKKAAYVGEYGALALLNYTSLEAKHPDNYDIVNEIASLIRLSRPQIIYTHNLADKHDTHVAVALRVIAAIRQIPEELRPEKVYGCEVWRSLDWMNDDDKVLFDVSAKPNIAASIIGVFDSQISGGKRYDLATEGRRLANATYVQSHNVDRTNALSYGMDLTPLIKDAGHDIKKYIEEHIRRFSLDVSKRLEKLI